MQDYKTNQISLKTRFTAPQFWFFRITNGKFENMKTYNVKFVDLEEPKWEKALQLTNFRDPWKNIEKTDLAFCALHSSERLYLRFIVDVLDPVVSGKSSDKMGVILSDRVEVFLTTDESLSSYYCLEIDFSGRALIYKAAYYRDFNFDWNWRSEHLSTVVKKDLNSYNVTISITKSSLKKLGLLKDGLILCGLYRGKPTSKKPYTDANFDWFSWIDPKTSKPDFHVPSSFGRLILEK